MKLKQGYDKCSLGEILIEENTIYFSTQSNPGKPLKNSNDSQPIRKKYLKQCLNEILNSDIDQIEIEDELCCGDNGGNWNTYKKIFEKFQKDAEKKSKKVFIFDEVEKLNEDFQKLEVPDKLQQYQKEELEIMKQNELAESMEKININEEETKFDNSQEETKYDENIQETKETKHTENTKRERPKEKNKIILKKGKRLVTYDEWAKSKGLPPLSFYFVN